MRADAEEGLADIAAGRVIDGDEVLRWIESWARTTRSKRRNFLSEIAFYLSRRG